MTIWDQLEKLDRRILYVVLIVLCSLGILSGVGKLPVKTDAQDMALYTKLMTIPVDKPVFIQSDWTNSTRGENLGHLESLLRILMGRKIKFAIYSVGDAQAVQITRIVIRQINEERKAQGLTTYSEGQDYVMAGLYPNAEGIGQDMNNDIRKAWGDRRAKMPDGSSVGIFDTPVLKTVNKVGDASLLVVITASSTIDTAVARLSKSVTMAEMCTGVMAPEGVPYFQAGQIVGLAGGLKAGYDMEYMMSFGINHHDPAHPDAEPKVVDEKHPADIPPVSEGKTFARADKYYATFHVAMFLLILAVFVGNVGMFVNRARKAA